MTLIHFSFCSAFILGLAGLALNRSHLLSALLCLEGTMLSMYVGLCTWPTMTMSFSFSLIPMLMLTFSACEAATGLALMVATTRTHGTDKLFSLNLLQC
uniref:NADH-ubiquinone oxidoreductase chain 4L n=1 Tax=Xenopus itombwensis TaxID=542840 RepID=A0A5J6CEZ0_9PIPI|nr:NADH dehydrogenase subunit 4L [Xenopus itombwensis]QEQ13600.1 NADH dehydrogenase subunit 4L [Xenopus itombwensis]